MAATKSKAAANKKSPRKSAVDKLREKVSRVPRRPGVYIFKARGEKILYVGKAKDLRARLRTYFQKSARLDNRKTSMVRQIRDLSYIVTGNELEALVLESNLIKQNRPRFNVVLRDDKSYPYLKLTVNEQWPRLLVTRRVLKDGAMYFGPYVPSASMREALDFVRRNFGLRPCRYRMDRPVRKCIQYEMGRCPAPCEGLVPHEKYMAEVAQVELFLRGKSPELLDELKERMGQYSTQQMYEDAARMRDRIAALKRAWESQKVISPELGDLDVVALHGTGGPDAAFQVFFVRGGLMVGSREFYLKENGDMPAPELMQGFLGTFYSGALVPPLRVVVDVRPSGLLTLKAMLKQKRGGAVSIVRPRGGKERELLAMARENASIHYEARRGTGGDALLGQLSQRLNLSAAPRSIGAVDVSSIHGASPVGALVWWERGEFQKDRYRLVNIRTVSGIDDYAMIRETISRALGSLDSPPDLLVVDGGRGHLEAARVALEALGDKQSPAALVAVAKKPDRAFTAHAAEPVLLAGEGSSLLLKKLRDEVHRFAIGSHKRQRGKSMLKSPLEAVPGIGKKRRLALLRHFGSLEALRRASAKEIAAVPGFGPKAARAVLSALSGAKIS